MADNIVQHVEEIVTEISMSCDGRPWIIVEGDSDEKFFIPRKLKNSPKFIVAFGWENVVEVISKVREENISTVTIGVIDRDYREYLNIRIELINIVETDLRDIEVMLGVILHARKDGDFMVARIGSDKMILSWHLSGMKGKEGDLVLSSQGLS